MESNMTEQQTSPSLAKLIETAIDSKLVDVHTAMPGVIQSYDPDTQTCDVQPSFKRKFIGDNVAVLLPVITNVPVCWPRAGNCFIHMPLKKDDNVLIVFSERNIGAWLKYGGVADPKDVRKHHLSDAVVIPGMSPKISPLVVAEADKEKLVIVNDNSKIALSTDGEIKIGNRNSSEKEPAVLGNVLKTALDALADALDSLADAVGTLPAGNTTTPGNPIVTNPALIAAANAVKLATTAFRTVYLDTSLTNIVSGKTFVDRG
jgi:hypothetical protein